MTKREVVKLALDFKRPPYVPWNFGFTVEAREKLVKHYGSHDLEPHFQNHTVGLGGKAGYFTDIGNGCVRDYWGVVWDRSVDKDIGVVKDAVIPEPTLKGFKCPDPLDPEPRGERAQEALNHGFAGG